MSEITTPKEAACFLACGACVAVMAWIVCAPVHFIETVAPLGRVLVGTLA
jgi:hypothetical protein